MPNNITADDVLTAPAQRTGPITAQDVIDAVPVQRRLQPQLVDQQGRDYNAADLDNINSPYDIPKLSVQQRPTGADQNVLPGRSGFKANFKAGFVEDPRVKIAQHAKALFPDDPNAAQRFGVRDGRVVYLDDEMKIRDVDSGFASASGAAAAYTPEAAGSIVGSFATGNPVTGGALGAVGGKGIKQIIAGLLFDDPQTMAGNAMGMAKEGAINFAAGGLMKGAGKFLDKGRVVDFTPAQLAGARATQEEVQRTTGIGLDLAQASQDPALMSLRKYAAKFPGESAQVFKALDELQTGQSADAMQKLVSTVSRAMSSEAAGRQGINAAQDAIRSARTIVSKQVQPLYEAAYAAVPEVSAATKEGAKALEFLKLPYFDQAFASGQKLRALETGSATAPRQRSVETLAKSDPDAGTFERATTIVDSTTTGAKNIISRLVSGERRVTPEGVLSKRTESVHRDITRPSLAELDYTKRALDEQIETLMDAGQRQRARALKIKRDEFVAALDALPNQQWQAARAKYGELAQSTIVPLEEGAIGVLAKIKEPKAATAAAKIFSDPNITANEIAFARAAVEKADPDAWRGLAGQYLGGVLDKALKVTQRGETSNLAGKLYQAMAGTPQQAAKLRAALPAEAQDTLQDVLTGLKFVAATERAGSDTAFNQLVTRKIEGRFSTTLKMLRQPVQTMIQAGEQRSLDNLVANLARGLTDPELVAQLRQVSRHPPGVQRSLQTISSLLLAPAARVGEDEVFPMSDQPIPALEPRRGRQLLPRSPGQLVPGR